MSARPAPPFTLLDLPLKIGSTLPVSTLPRRAAAMTITTRDDLPALLTHHRLTRLGVELGVAGGAYSEHLLSHAPIRRLYSIDAWSGDRGHDIVQCDAATRRLSK
ncbi:MAG: hypothetical protein KDN20_18335 [Verrucomicrobiae bacterium]|nr:hypothetical protein [Verrucomicrobiae bacterium]